MNVLDLKTNMRVMHKENGRKLKFNGRGRGDEYIFRTIGGSYASLDHLTAKQVENYEPIFKKKKMKPKKRSTTSVKICYDLGEEGLKFYTVPRVIGFTVRVTDSVVNVTSEKLVSEGVTVRENTTIKFSELLHVHYLSPTKSVGYNFENGELLSKVEHNFKDNFVDHF